MKKLKRTINDAKQPIIKECQVDVRAIWNRAYTQTVSQELTPRIKRALSGVKLV